MAVGTIEHLAMLRALELARRGPAGINPQVGAVFLSPEGEVLAEGWHRGAGTPHAEIDALVRIAPDAAHGSTAVVTLEPCNHRGRTGPCAQALIDAGVARVVYALDDPGELSGGGADRLRAAGVDVVAGLAADEAALLVGPWLTATRLGRPEVTVKWAQSLDGRAAAHDGSSKWLTGPEARADVHRRRAEAAAILVGTGTLLADDPSLTARRGEVLYEHQPMPVVMGHRPVPSDAAVWRHPVSPAIYATHDVSAVLTDLHDRGVHSVFVEGGPTVASAFLAAGVVDRMLVYIAPLLVGGSRMALTDIGVGSLAQAQRLTVRERVVLGDDMLWVAQRDVGAQHEGGSS
ncbi:bifunctional diaminohydroxyphosphoribosylaminopyrimidine deaminase/5-amino-6-(5-phosphoribosylamino)uracil reductase RibD [Microbacterium sp. YY-01]|uniref:bifunctional diaminohydroxyphosphoribosylaminopyrimidine deaminase/5-amino-6-(5-phosphoribosylamino)uracil reductase RibD n=1 Tax=Microbacterium sp. YY-01 TaxID=3421634 RepID=UPI003D17F570